MAAVTYLAAACLTHRRVPLALLGQLPRGDALSTALQRLTELPGVEGALLLSTCNRFEVYLSSRLPLAQPQAGHALTVATGVPASTIEGLFDVHSGAAAVHHLFAVAAGLDSRLLGEGEILGQLRAASHTAASAGCLDMDLATLSQWAVRAGRRARRASGWNGTKTSVAEHAVHVLDTLLDGVAGQRVLVVGAGRVAERAVQVLSSGGAVPVVCARDPERARETFEAIAVEPLDRMPALLRTVDAVICATSAPQPILGVATLADALGSAARQPLVVLDLAVPRNVEPEAADLADLVCLDLDGLAHYDSSAGIGTQSAEAATRTVDAEVASYLTAQTGRRAGQMLTQVTSHAEAVRRGEVSRVAGRTSEAELALIDEVSRRVMNKLLHSPLTVIRAMTAAGDVETAERMAGILAGEVDEPVMSIPACAVG
jgi:glutamyl-tRNA reductase